MLARIPLTKEERKLRRAARREKQRQANIGRARKMHLARVEKERSGCSELPAIQDEKHQLHIGCSGWFYWHWRGAFYPADLPTSRWFPHYAGRFETVELNAPFYSWPTVATVESWIRQAGRRRFVYTVKVCELITHLKRFAGTTTLVRDFGLIADLLGPRMGCFLFQLPPSFHYTPARLKRILGQLDHRRRNVVEFRHKSWWNETVYKAFRETGTIFCSCSGPRLPDQLIKTADDIYIRFHGVKTWYRHDYTIEELDVWAKRIVESKAKTVWAYFNNDRDGYAIKNARALSRLLRRRVQRGGGGESNQVERVALVRPQEDGLMAARKKTASRKSATPKKSGKRELMAPNGDKRYVRRDRKGRIAKSVEVGRSLSADRRRKAKGVAERGQGDRGDERR